MKAVHIDILTNFIFFNMKWYKYKTLRNHYKKKIRKIFPVATTSIKRAEREIWITKTKYKNTFRNFQQRPNAKHATKAPTESRYGNDSAKAQSYLIHTGYFYAIIYRLFCS